MSKQRARREAVDTLDRYRRAINNSLDNCAWEEARDLIRNLEELWDARHSAKIAEERALEALSEAFGHVAS